MKLTKKQLQKLIQEELEVILQEETAPDAAIQGSLQRIIQEEYETMVGPEIVTDPLTGQEYEDPYGGVAANLATFGEAYPGAYEEYAARGDEEYDPSTAPRLFRGEGEWSAHMTPEWQETVRANKAREDAEAAAIMQGILDADNAAMESTVPPNPLFEE